MKVLITGAQFKNKGAQSLLFSMVDQLRKKDPDIDIYYLPLDDYRKYNKDDFRFNIIYGGMEAHYYENKPYMRPYLLLKAFARKLIKKGSVGAGDVRALHRVLPEIDAIIDVSGYQLTSKFPNEMNRKFLYYIEEAKRYSKKVVLMPQSFGPFDYKEQKDEMMALIRKNLNEADLVFARESEGYDILKDQFSVSKLRLSPDLVLQTGEIDYSTIYTTIPAFDYPKLETTGNVAVIPNSETFRHGSEQTILGIYKNVIEHLLAKDKEIYIFRHSNDLSACEKIYRMFEGSQKVHLIKEEFECAEYSEFVKQFDYIITSRYHAIVHAYKESVPAVIFGWAIKYQELAKLFGQSGYVFDITSGDADLNAISASLDEMELRHRDESARLTETLESLKEHSCFDLCWDTIK